MWTMTDQGIGAHFHAISIAFQFLRNGVGVGSVSQSHLWAKSVARSIANDCHGYGRPAGGGGGGGGGRGWAPSAPSLDASVNPPSPHCPLMHNSSTLL